MSSTSRTAGNTAAVLGLTRRLAALDFTRGDAAGASAERIDQLRALEELKAAVAAAQVRVTAALTVSEQRRSDEEHAARVPAGSEGFEAWRARRDAERSRSSVGAQVGFARRLSPHQGARQVTIATALVEDLPATLAALEVGVISEWRASIIVRESSSLTRPDRRLLDAELATDPDRLASWGDKELTGRVRAIAYRLDAQAAVERAAKAAQDRRVSLRPAPDAMSQLGALLPVAGGVAVISSLQQAAATARAQGDPRGRGQVMADTLIERVTGQAAAAAVPVEVQVVISDTTLLGQDDAPARIPGYGPVPAGIARDLLKSSADEDAKVWLRRLYTHPQSGALTQVESTRRVFPRGMRRFITTRDQTCRTPWCDAAIRHIDHLHDHARGGRTSLSNGQGTVRTVQLPQTNPRLDHRNRPVRTWALPSGPGHHPHRAHLPLHRPTTPPRTPTAPTSGTTRDLQPPRSPDRIPPQRLAAAADRQWLRELNVRVTRDAVATDVDSIVELAERRRVEYEFAQPQFWRRAPDAVDKHRPWIAAQVASDDVISIVEPGPADGLAGFVLGTLVDAPPVYDPGGPTGLIDDFAVADASLWSSTGRRLLEEALRRLRERGATQVTVVCGHHDRAKRSLLSDAGLAIASEWYVKPIS